MRAESSAAAWTASGLGQGQYAPGVYGQFGEQPASRLFVRLAFPSHCKADMETLH